MASPRSVYELLQQGAGSDPAIGAPGRGDLSYAGLRDLVEATGRALAGAGIGPGDRVGIVLANGPAMATCFLAVAAHATAAPLNPGYRADEFDFYISDLKAKAVIVAAGEDTPARAVAEKHGATVIDLTEDDSGPAGSFMLDVGGSLPDAAPPADPGDTALVLHTSGTTSRPKIVPLSGANLAASAGHIAASLALKRTGALKSRLDSFERDFEPEVGVEDGAGALRG